MESASSPYTGSHGSRLETTAGLIALGLCVVALIWIVWMSTPDHRKARMNLTLLRLSRRALSQHARRIGGLSMARELASGGRVQEYDHSYRLALAVDRLDAKINLITAGLS